MKTSGILSRGIGGFLFVLVVLGPVLALAARSIHDVASGHADWLLLALPTGRRLQLLLQSVGFAASVALAGTCAGFVAATALWRWRSGFRPLLLVMALLPAYVHTLAWSTAFAALNALLEPLGFAGIPLRGWGGAIFIQTMALLPAGVYLALVGLESLDRNLIEAARLAAPDAKVLGRVILPLAAPMLAAGAGLLFLLSLIDYTVPSLCLVNVYALEIFAEFGASNEPGRAFLLSLPLLVVTLAALSFAHDRVKHAAQTTGGPRAARPLPPRWPPWFQRLQCGALALLALQIAVPLATLGVTASGWRATADAVSAARNEVFFSFGVCAATALLCLALSPLAALWLWQRSHRNASVWLLLFVPLAVPAPLAGIGLIALWNQPDWHPLYGTRLMPVLAGAARFCSVAAMVLLAQLRQTDPLLFDATRVFQRRPWRGWWRVRLPMLAPGLLAAGCIVFALALGELGATLIVAPPGHATLTMRIYNYLHYGASATVAALCLTMTLLTLAAAGLAAAALKIWHRVNSNEDPS
ncbi:MAG: iron ABC transporter permease [Verrucomicrobia bacterium]|nr:iron ABC transporter permease [Verrucomicrobiota bacterium]